jgi:hypothetical protein
MSHATGYQPAPMNALIRTQCTNCDGRSIEWMSRDQAKVRVDAEFVIEAVMAITSAMGNSIKPDRIDFWRCSKCGHAGALPRAWVGW